MPFGGVILRRQWAAAAAGMAAWAPTSYFCPAGWRVDIDGCSECLLQSVYYKRAAARIARHSVHQGGWCTVVITLAKAHHFILCCAGLGRRSAALRLNPEPEMLGWFGCLPLALPQRMAWGCGAFLFSLDVLLTACLRHKSMW